MLKMPITWKGQEALNMGESARYVGLTYPALNARIEKYNATHPDAMIEKQKPTGGRSVYVFKADLDKLLELHPLGK